MLMLSTNATQAELTDGKKYTGRSSSNCTRGGRLLARREAAHAEERRKYRTGRADVFHPTCLEQERCVTGDRILFFFQYIQRVGHVA